MKKARMIVNIAMTVVLLCLMAYTLVGETAHEVLGTGMFILFIIHHILNRKWFGAVTKGRYNSFRILQTTLVFLMILSILASMVSGIMVEQAVYISAADQWYVDRKKRAYGLCISEYYFDVPAFRPSLECHDESYDEEEGEWFKSLDLDFKDRSIRCCHIWNLCFCK